MKRLTALTVATALTISFTAMTTAGAEGTTPSASPPSADAAPRPARAPNVKVMTRNIYVGTDVDVVLAAQNPEQVPVLVAQAFQTLLATNFQERAKALADEIKRNRPHLVGLQEVSLIRTQSPGDAVVGGTTPAETVLFDYLAILMDALKKRGLRYRVAGIIADESETERLPFQEKGAGFDAEDGPFMEPPRQA